MKQKVITVFGNGSVKPDSSQYKLASQLGYALGKAGFSIANGGYGGTMQAVSQSAAEFNVNIIGVTCSAFSAIPNEYLSQIVNTDSLDERLNALIELGQAYVVLPGSTGTLLELAKVWELKNKKFPDAQKPIILLGDFWKPLIDIIETQKLNSKDSLIVVDSTEQTVHTLTQNL